MATSNHQPSTDMPRISIVTPSYNQGAYLEETIRSVLDQGYPNLEYIVMDGGSTDNSVAIIRKYESRLAHWQSAKDRGQSDAINKGFTRSTGDILAFLNSDDVYEPGCLEDVARSFEARSDVDLFYAGYRYIDEHGRDLRLFRAPPFDFAALLLGNFVAQPSVFMRREVFERVGPFSMENHYSMDYEYWLRAAMKGFRFEPVDKLYARMRMHPASKTVGGDVFAWPALIPVFRRLVSDPEMPVDMRPYAVRGAARIHWLAAIGLLRARRDVDRMRALARDAIVEFGLPGNLDDLHFALHYLLVEPSSPLVYEPDGALMSPRHVASRIRMMGLDRGAMRSFGRLVEEAYLLRLCEAARDKEKRTALAQLVAAAVARPSLALRWGWRQAVREVLSRRRM